MLLVAGLARTSAATASILLNLELAATVALAATVFREHLGRRVIGGAGLVTVAGALLVWEPGAEVSIGALLIVAACVAWGFDNGVTARIDHLAPEHVVALKGFLAGGVNVVLGFFTVGSGSPLTLAQVGAALLIGALGYGVSIVLWVKGARDLGADRGPVLFATAPFIGAALAWVVLGENASAAQFMALLVAAIGVAVTMESTHEHQHSHRDREHEHEHRHDDGHHHHDHEQPVEAGARHSHRHRHRAIVHSHPHIPDLHHRHEHA